MPKVPNYSACHEEEVHNGYLWKHDDKNHIKVKVTKQYSDDEPDELWCVEVWNYAHCFELGSISKSKEDMREEAVHWMRENPEGWTPDN